MNMVATNAVNLMGKISAAGYDPGVTPNGNAPWMGTLRTIAGYTLATAIIVALIVLIVGVVLLIVGKISHHGGAQNVGVGVLLWGLVGCAILGSLSGLVYWATQQSLT